MRKLRHPHIQIERGMPPRQILPHKHRRLRHASIARQPHPLAHVPQIILLPPSVLRVKVKIREIPRVQNALDPSLRQDGKALDPQFGHDGATHPYGLVGTSVDHLIDGGHLSGDFLIEHLVGGSAGFDRLGHHAEDVAGGYESHALLLEFRDGLLTAGVVVHDHHSVELARDAQCYGLAGRGILGYYRFDPTEGVFSFEDFGYFHLGCFLTWWRVIVLFAVVVLAAGSCCFIGIVIFYWWYRR
mmetsp:Transcript_13989/g.24949  ORF Transcript_13989/g.24949 Transcript_13989/m.24949 type:complete len:243 (+) Transcript_13989:1203-1931(+)